MPPPPYNLNSKISIIYPLQTSPGAKPIGPLLPTPVAAPPQVKEDVSGQGEVFQEEEDPCVICHEEMTPPSTAQLDCGHRFHDDVSPIIIRPFEKTGHIVEWRLCLSVCQQLDKKKV